MSAIGFSSSSANELPIIELNSIGLVSNGLNPNLMKFFSIISNNFFFNANSLPDLSLKPLGKVAFICFSLFILFRHSSERLVVR